MRDLSPEPGAVSIDFLVIDLLAYNKYKRDRQIHLPVRAKEGRERIRNPASDESERDGIERSKKPPYEQS